MTCQRVVWTLAIVFPVALAAVTNAWIYPDPSNVTTLNYVDIVNTTWTSNYTHPYLILWCREGESAFAAEYNQSVLSSGSRSVPLNYGRALGCHFEVHQYQPENVGLNSGTTFIEWRPDKEPVIWSQEPEQNALAASGTAVSTASSVLPTAAATSSMATTSTESSANDGLSTGAKAGIGVGVTLGVLAIAIAAFLILRKQRLHKQNMTNDAKYEGSSVAYHPVQELGKNEIPVEPSEMAGTHIRHELPQRQQ